MGGGGVPSGGTYITEGRNLKPIGKPNSRMDMYQNGTKVQSRWYGPDGKARRNRDYRHQDAHKNHSFPHDHKWDWTKNTPRIPNNLPPDFRYN